MKTKKPDNVVYNEETNRYDAYLKPYGTNIGAPAIKVPQTMNWKGQQIHKANQVIGEKFNAIKQSYDALLKQIEINELVYNSRYSLVPIIGKVYHLYRAKDKESFLSIIPPYECNFDFIGSFKINADGIWESIDSTQEISLA